MPLAWPAGTETFGLLAARVYVTDLDVEMDADLGGLRFRDLLEGQPRQVIQARAHSGPIGVVTMFTGDRPVQQRAPEGRQPSGVSTVDRDPSLAISHTGILAPQGCGRTQTGGPG